jgi:hypothetical protein
MLLAVGPAALDAQDRPESETDTAPDQAVAPVAPEPGPADAGQPSPRAGLDRRAVAFPEGELFRPLVADPKQPRFSGSLEHVRARDADTSFRAAFISFGEEFGLWGLWDERGGWQLSLLGGVFAQFNLDPSTSYALINADYTIGFPISWRRDGVAVRARVYHQSSHLGDELLLENPDIQRINLSFEELELLGSWDLPHTRVRVYGGGGILLHRHPTLNRYRLQCGAEWRGPGRVLHRAATSGSARLVATPIAAIDMKSFGELGWNLNVRMLAGAELSKGPGGRAVRLFADYYRGHYPFGQFYGQRMWNLGLGVSLGF